MSVSHNKVRLSAPNNKEAYADSLRGCLSQIIALCAQKGVALFNGTYQEAKTDEVVWEGTGPEEWKKYLEAVFASGTKILVYSLIDYPLDTKDTQDFIDKILPTLDESDREVFWQSYKEMQGRSGHVASLDLYFSYQGIWYNYTMDAEWFPHYDTLSEMIMNLPATPIKEGGFPDDRDELSEGEKENWARKIVADYKYLQAKSRRERVDRACTLLEEAGMDGMFLPPEITGRAEALFQKEVVPVREEELKQKVLVLKRKGTRKNEAKGILGISLNKLEKYWYL